MVKLPKNGVLLVQTRNTLYTLVICETVGMAIQGHEKYCPNFTEIDKVIIHPGLPMQFHLKIDKMRDGKWITTSPVRDIQVLKSFLPRCEMCDKLIEEGDETMVEIADKKVTVCGDCIGEMSVPAFHQHVDLGDSI